MCCFTQVFAQQQNYSACSRNFLSPSVYEATVSKNKQKQNVKTCVRDGMSCVNFWSYHELFVLSVMSHFVGTVSGFKASYLEFTEYYWFCSKFDFLNHSIVKYKHFQALKDKLWASNCI